MSVLPNEGNLPAGGDQGANSEPSQQQGQPLEELIAKALSPLQAQIKALQSDKDKAAYRAENLSKANAEEIARLGQIFNKTPDEILAAQRQAILEDVVNERLNPMAQTIQAPAGPVAGVGSGELADIDRELDLPINDPRVTQLKLTHGSNPVKYAIEAAKLKGSLNQSPPTPAEQPLPVSTIQPQRQQTPNALQQEYEKQRDEIAKRGLSTENRIEMLTNLKASYRAKGLNLR